MKLFVEKSYEINIYGDIDINIKDYVDWLEKKIPTRENLKEIPTRENLQEYIEEKLEFYDNIKAFCGLEKRAQAKEICDDITNFILDALSKGYKVPFLGLGKLYVRKTKARIGRNPTTGEIVHIKAKSRVRFAPAKSLVDFSD